MFKKITLQLFICLLTLTNLHAQTEFITTWKTDNSGVTDENTITFPVGYEDPSLYNFDIDWGDGTTSSNLSTVTSHTYANPGTYTVTISGDYPSINNKFNGDRTKLISIEQWGTQQWLSMAEAFSNCSNLSINATDTPDLSMVTTMKSMLYNVPNINPAISNWNVGNVTDMSKMFGSGSGSSFNQPIGNWDVSSVTDMSGMFANATTFNQSIDNWDVSNVTDMSSMFSNSNFNQPIGNWDVSSVTDMSAMFNLAPFNQNISIWDVSNVTDMTSMFNRASFNQDISNWSVNNVTNMSQMFFYSSFNQPIGNWDVSSVTDMSFMFVRTAFNQDISNWSVNNVTNMSFMFYRASFNQDISNWSVNNVTNMSQMFFYSSFNQPIGNWDVSSVTDMSFMFVRTAFNQDISNWSVNNVTNMSYMFYDATAFNQDIGSWDISNVTDMSFMFLSSLSITNYDNTLIGWNTLDTAAGETQIPTNITFGGGNSKYCNGEAARTNLIDTYGWTITDGNLDSNCSTLSIDNFDTSEIVLYPNPVATSFTVKGLDNDTYNLQIINLQGQVLKTLEYTNGKPVAIEELANGVYIVKVQSDQNTKTVRIIKSN